MTFDRSYEVSLGLIYFFCNLKFLSQKRVLAAIMFTDIIGIQL